MTNEPEVKRPFFGSKGYRWFETGVVAALTLLVSLSVVLTLVQAGWALFDVVVVENHILDHESFIKVFGAFMTVLIALEFNNTVLPDMTGKTPVVKVRAVLLVALLALARKVVLIDFKEMDWAAVVGLAVLILGVTAAYWAIQHEEMQKSGEGKRAG